MPTGIICERGYSPNLKSVSGNGVVTWNRLIYAGGVETVSTEEEHAKELLVLKVCLAEVERSRPFLIGLIGDRYGWVPPEDRMAAAAQEAGFNQSVAGRSVTDLEIDFGVLSNSDQQPRCFFYFRAPLPYDQMPPTVAAEYSEQHRSNVDTPQAVEKLIRLKQRILDTLPERTRAYTAQWDATSQTVTGFEAWGQMVLEDLWVELDAETRNYRHQTELTWQEEERWALEQFVEDEREILLVEKRFYSNWRSWPSVLKPGALLGGPAWSDLRDQEKVRSLPNSIVVYKTKTCVFSLTQPGSARARGKSI